MGMNLEYEPPLENTRRTEYRERRQDLPGISTIPAIQIPLPRPRMSATLR